MKFDLSMLKFVALILFVVAAILFFAKAGGVAASGLLALGLACRVAADVKL
jgi:hypothetical protein